jgi:hypothetical protein
MTRDDLLALQESLIHGVSGEAEPAGIDPTRLEFVRELARAKRIAKIESALPRTCRALGDQCSRLASQFVNAHPARNFRSRADGLAFYMFLRRRRATPWLLDLAYCELALSAVRTNVPGEQPALGSGAKNEMVLRRAVGLRLRACRFNVRAFFEGDGTETPAEIPEVQTHLAIIADPLAGAPRMLQLSASAFDFLRALRTWRVLPEVTDADMETLLEQLQQSGLLEIATSRLSNE